MKKFIITEQERKHILSLYEQTQPQQFSKFVETVALILGVPTERLSVFDSIANALNDPNKSNDQNLRNQLFSKIGEEVNGLKLPIAILARDKMLDTALNQLKNYQGQVSGPQKKLLDSVIQTLQNVKGPMENYITSLTDDQWNQLFQELQYGTQNPMDTSNRIISSLQKAIGQDSNFTNQIQNLLGGGSTVSSGQTTNTGTTVSSNGTTTGSTQSQTGEKINTTSDRSFDYKLSNGEYFFKGKANTSFGSKYPNWTKATGTALDSIKTKIRF